VHPLVFERSGEIPPRRSQFGNNAPSHKLIVNDNLQECELLHHALYLMSLYNHTFSIYHLVVVVLLNDIQFSVNI
jgi:hypothetical protein